MKPSCLNNHSLTNIIYGHQSVVVFLFLLPLIIVGQFGNKILFVILSGVLFIVSLTLDNWIKDSFISLHKLFLLAFVLGVISLLTVPSRIPSGITKAVIDGDVYNISDYYADVKVTTYNRMPLFPPARVRVNGKKEFAVGDRVILEVDLVLAEEATNPGQFNYRKYLQQKGIYVVSQGSRVLSRSPSLTLSGMAFKARQLILTPLRNKLPGDIFGLYSAMVIGERDSLDGEIYGYFQAAGVAHVLVISGMHVGLIAGLLLMFLTRIRISLKKAAFLTIAFIWSYAFISGLAVSVLRAAIMLTIALVARVFYQINNPLNTLATVAIIVLVINPLSLTGVGWQLSFAASAGILIILPSILNQFGNSKLVNAMGVVLGAQLATLPIIINTFNYFSLYSVPANITIVPISFITLILGLLYTIPVVRLIIHYPLIWLLRANVLIARFWGSLPYAKFSLRKWPLWMIAIYILLLITIILLIKRKRYRLGTGIFTLCFIICAFSLMVNAWQIEITFLDVDQGDSAVVKWPNGYVMVVDGGDKSDYTDFGQKTVLPFLRQAGINRIDALVVSHSDKDHIGGLLSVAEELIIRTLYLTPQAYYSEGELVKKLIRTCRLQGAEIKMINDKDTLKVMPNSIIEVYHPENNIDQIDGNNSSLVLRLVYGKMSVLFTGDIECNSEARITGKYGSLLESDIVKVPHHGSRTSSTDTFIDCVKPKIAVFSAGRNNRFGHPHYEVVEKYKSEKTGIWRTDCHGAITIKSNGSKISISSYLQAKQVGEFLWEE